MTTQHIRIGASLGLLALAIAHAIFLAVALSVPKVVEHQWYPHDPDQWRAASPGFSAGDLSRSHGTDFDKLPQIQSSPVKAVAPINSQARDEVKHQRGSRTPIYRPTQPQPCIDCQTQRYPVVIYPSPSVPSVHHTPSQPRPTPIQPSPLIPDPVPLITPSTPAKAPAKYELALFLDGSTRSQQLQQWFATHEGLAKLKAKCSFQVYTVDNALYQQRFAKVVPVEMFPAILFLRPDGGHIHAAGGELLPSTADALWSDLKTGFELMKSMEPVKPALQAGIALPGFINQDWGADCPDGMCPPNAVDREPLFPWLHPDRDQQPGLQGPLRDLMSTGGQMAILMIGVAAIVFLTAMILIVKFRGPPAPPTNHEPWMN